MEERGVNMLKKVTIYLEPIVKHIEIDDNLDEREVEEEINRHVYDMLPDEIAYEAKVDYWE